MALFGQALVTQITATVRGQHNRLGAFLGLAPEGQTPPHPAPLDEAIALLIQVANGAIARSSATHATERAVEEALVVLFTGLTGNALGAHVPLDEAFWQTEVGTLAARVRWWLSADELISISNAAALAFGTNTQATRMRIARAIDSGLLEWFPDPSAANPQHSRRVLRTQVERLRDMRQLPA